MAKPELGLKRTCVDCSVRFYDLNRVPAICPKCGGTQPSDVGRLKPSDEPLPEEKGPNAPQDEHDTDVDLDTGDDADDVIDSDDDLDDDDDLSNDIELTTDKDDRDDN